MKITVIYGQHHKGNTWNLTRLFLNQFENAQISEFFLPKSAPSYCIGCLKCMYEGEAFCPHAEKVQPIAAALDEADLIVFASPCYVMNMTGQMKALMDHMGYRYMSHRPEPSMFRKQGDCIIHSRRSGCGKNNESYSGKLVFLGCGENLSLWNLGQSC